MKKIKILQFPIANSYGGITHYALNNWKWMDKNKFQCDFATMSKKLDFADEILETGSKIHYISCYAEENREQFIKEVNQILDEGYDVVHLHTKQWKSFLMEEICLERKVLKIIVHSHSTRCDANDAEKRELETKEHYRVRELFNENLATDFWACSKSAAEWLFGERIPENKIKIMNNAIETEEFVYKKDVRQRLRKEFGVEDKFVIGNIGRLVYQKNQEFLLDVFAKVAEFRKNVVLMIIGDGELKEKLQLQSQKLGIEEQVMFLGKRSDTNDLYQMLDLFVLTSRFEGLPISMIEAQTAGLRCLCSDTVTREIDITGNVRLLPLVNTVWSKAIGEEVKEYTRENMYQIITEAGYNNLMQIKRIEREYLAL